MKPILLKHPFHQIFPIFQGVERRLRQQDFVLLRLDLCVYMCGFFFVCYDLKKKTYQRGERGDCVWIFFVMVTNIPKRRLCVKLLIHRMSVHIPEMRDGQICVCFFFFGFFELWMDIFDFTFLILRQEKNKEKDFFFK